MYASAVVALQQHHDNSFCCERIGLAAALSHVVYQAPLGKVYPEIQKQLNGTQAPIEALLDSAKHLVPSDNPTTSKNDGNGIGFILVATWAMQLFGPHLSSLSIFMLGLMALSAATFLWRFGDDRSVVVTATFFSLTLMLCTPLVWNSATASQIALGGIRYYSVVAIVSGFHLVLELTDRDAQTDVARSRDSILLAVQVIVLALAILVRGSTAYLAGPILIIGLVTAWRKRNNRNELRRLCREAAVIVLVSVVFVGSLLLALPRDYVRDGHLAATTEIWHRAVVSLGVNPSWPFGNLREIYDCRNGGIPEGLTAGALDRNGHCIWWHYIATHAPEAALQQVYSSVYEAAMRAAFFDIARLYPDEVLVTFFYYKPAWLLQAMEYLALNPAVPSPILMTLVIASFANFLLFLVIVASSSVGSLILLRLTGLGTLFGVSSIPPYFTAWATPHTTADLLFYCLFCISLGIGSAMQPIGAAVRRRSAMLVRRVDQRARRCVVVEGIATKVIEPTVEDGSEQASAGW
jgi:hypothetical protein